MISQFPTHSAHRAAPAFAVCLLLGFTVLTDAAPKASGGAEAVSPTAAASPQLLEKLQRKISQSFKDTDITTAIEILAKEAKVNLAMPPDQIRGKVTLILEEVALEDALEAVLKTGNLSWRVEKGDILRILPPGASMAEPSLNLTIPDDGFTLKPYSEGGLFEAVVAIRNDSDRDAPKFQVHFYRNEPGKSDALIQGAVNGAGPIAPRGVWNECSAPFALPEGVSLLKVVLDPENAVPESDKRDNTALLTVTLRQNKIVKSDLSFPLESSGSGGGGGRPRMIRQKADPAAMDFKAALAEAAQGKIVQTLPIQKDCMILQYLPDWNYGLVDNIATGNNDGGVRTLIAWPSIPPELALQKDRRFLVALFSRETVSTPPQGRLQVHELLAEWPEATSWKTQPAFTEKPAASEEFAPGPGWKLFDVTQIVRGQAEAKRPSFGALLRFDQENRNGNGEWSGYAFVSREGENPWSDSHPVLLILESKE